MAIYWPTPGYKGRTFKLCVLTRWDFNFCIRSSPLRGQRMSMTRRRMITIQTLDFKFACRGTSSGVVRLAGPAKVTQKLKTEKKKKKPNCAALCQKSLRTAKKLKKWPVLPILRESCKKNNNRDAKWQNAPEFLQICGEKQTNKQTKNRFCTPMKSQKN